MTDCSEGEVKWQYKFILFTVDIDYQKRTYFFESLIAIDYYEDMLLIHGAFV